MFNPGIVRPGPIQNRGPLAPQMPMRPPIMNLAQPQGMPMPMMAPQMTPQLPRGVRHNKILDELREAMLEARLAQLQKARERM